MSFLKNIFGKKEETIESYNDFWNWFLANEKNFFSVVKEGNSIEKKFFSKLSLMLSQIKDDIYYLTGMFDDRTAELILTADGNARTIAFVEELIEAAPQIKGWKFTALKPATKSDDFKIDMDGYTFSSENIYFYSNDYPDFPDEIDIDFVYEGLNDENRGIISNGIYIYLDNYLGEIDFVNQIDNLQIVSKENASKELVPISKLKDFLLWRQKEFIEKYEGIRYDTENDEYSIFEAKSENGNGLVAVINTELLNWDAKASHPWIAILTIKFDGNKTFGMPNNDDYELLSEIEEKIMNQLFDKDGYLNIGRETANNERDIYFSCVDFRKPSKVFYEIQKAYKDRYEIYFNIFKDKYWQSFERYRQN